MKICPVIMPGYFSLRISSEQNGVFAAGHQKNYIMWRLFVVLAPIIQLAEFV
jgi:hypothetical protein